MRLQNVFLVNVADDLRTPLERDALINDCTVLGVASTASDAIKQIDNLACIPDVIFFGVEDNSSLACLSLLSRKFLSTVFVAVSSQSGNTALVVEALHSGASKILLVPWTRDGLGELLQDIALHQLTQQNQASVVGVVSEQSGVGSTSVSVNLAYELSTSFNKKVILIEVPEEFSTVPIFLGLDLVWGLQDLLALEEGPDLVSIEKTLVSFDENLKVLPASAAPSPISTDSYSALATIIRYCRNLCDIVVLEVSNRNRNLQMHLLRQADHVLMVANQSLPCLSVISQCVSSGSLSFPFRVVVNKYEPGMMPIEAIEKFLKVDSAWTIRFDSVAFSKSLALGQPMRIASPRSAVVKDFACLAADVVGNKPVRNGNGMVARLKRLFVASTY